MSPGENPGAGTDRISLRSSRRPKTFVIFAVGAITDPGSSEWPRPSEWRISWTTSQPRPTPTSKLPYWRRTDFRPNPDHTSAVISAPIAKVTPYAHPIA